ncbi:MAG: hypothetical protein ACFFKA_00010 [Candidatus Thorarchaeota archaeon]
MEYFKYRKGGITEQILNPEFGESMMSYLKVKEQGRSEPMYWLQDSTGQTQEFPISRAIRCAVLKLK